MAGYDVRLKTITTGPEVTEKLKGLPPILANKMLRVSDALLNELFGVTKSSKEEDTA